MKSTPPGSIGRSSILSRKPAHFDGLTVRNDGRLLAVGTDVGVLLWDLARGTELAYMPIQVAWHLMFEESGDLITSGPLGVNRWPIQVRRSPRRGPHRSATPASGAGG